MPYRTIVVNTVLLSIAPLVCPAGDVDDDGRCEVLYLTRDSMLHVLDGQTGREKAAATPPDPDQAQRWEVAMLADFRGAGGDRDLLLQATDKDGYRMGKFLAAYSMADPLRDDKPLWQTDEFVSCAHNSARLADLDGDGRDEVLGATILSAEGKLLTRAIPDRYHPPAGAQATLDRPELPPPEAVPQLLFALKKEHRYNQVPTWSGRNRRFHTLPLWSPLPSPSWRPGSCRDE